MAKSTEVKEGICYMCTNTCLTAVHVRDGKVVKIDIADPKVAHCPRWKAQQDFIYHPDRLQYPAESPLSLPEMAKAYPLALTSGARVMAYTHSQYRNIPRLRKLMPEPLADINPADAKPRGIKNGDKVTISSPRRSIMMKANVTNTILAGVVSLPHQWPGEANVNVLVDDLTLDPISGFLPCKSQLCQVEKSK